jgi:hypothetical protein
MDDSFQKAIRESDAKASQRTERRESLVGSAQARADTLAGKAADALKAALSGYAGLDQEKSFRSAGGFRSAGDLVTA